MFVQDSINVAIYLAGDCKILEAYQDKAHNRGTGVSLVPPDSIKKFNLYSGLVSGLLDEAHDFIRLDLAPFCIVNRINRFKRPIFVTLCSVEFRGVCAHEQKKAECCNYHKYKRGAKHVAPHICFPVLQL